MNKFLLEQRNVKVYMNIPEANHGNWGSDGKGSDEPEDKAKNAFSDQ